MRRHTLATFALSASVGLLLGCESSRPLEPTAGPDLARKPAATGFATLSKLPSLSHGGKGNAAAYAVQHSGGIVAGYSYHNDGRLLPVTWTLQNGTWTVASLPIPATAVGGRAKGVNDQGDVAGNDWPGTAPHAVLWPSTGGFEVLGCNDELGEVSGVSAGGRTLAGVVNPTTGSPGLAAVWEPGQCRVDLPPLVAGGSARADAVNGNGDVVGGSANAGSFSVPVRWARVGGAWTITALDSRQGAVRGGNSAGDLVGYVKVPCALPAGCNLGMIWYAAGGTRALPTLGGSHTTPVGINSAGEVVGLSSLANEDGTAFFWSETMGMRQLPVTGGGWAFAVSGVRADGTRLVVGEAGGAVVWVVRNP
jgi:uncharacterized membrane protein